MNMKMQNIKTVSQTGLVLDEVINLNFNLILAPS